MPTSPEQAKENFQRLVKAESTNAQFRAIQEEVIRANQGKSREQIIAIFQERQKQFAMSLQKQALDSARAGILPQLRKDAKEELIDERLKLQEAKKLGIEVTDDDVKRMLQGLAESNKMTYDQFAQHLKGMGVDISTMARAYSGRRGPGANSLRAATARRSRSRSATSIACCLRRPPKPATIRSSCRCSKITLGLPSQDRPNRRWPSASPRRRPCGASSAAAVPWATLPRAFPAPSSRI